MSKHISTLMVALGISGIMSSAAYADNVQVENALRNQPDLSIFYGELVRTGVNHDLKEGMHYTIFAPTNEAWASMKEKHACFFTAACSAQAAVILRNHIVPGDVYADDAVSQHGGVYSISGRFVAFGAPRHGGFAIAGNSVSFRAQGVGGMLYTIDGVVASNSELDSLDIPDYAGATEASSVSTAEGEVSTTTTTSTIADPACGPAGCPESSVTTITHTIGAPAYTEH